MSAEQLLDNVMSQVVEAQGTVVPCPINLNPDGEKLADIRDKIAEADAKFKAALDRHTSALAFGIPALVVVFVLLAIYQDRLFGMAPGLPTTGFFGHILILWTVAALMAAPIYHYLVRRRYSAAKDALWKEQQSYVEMQLSTEAGRTQYFREELFRLSSKATRVFFDDEKRFNLASRWAAKAGNILNGTDKTAPLSSVQNYLNSLRELISREEREQNDETRWQKWAITIMFLYVGGLVTLAFVTNSNENLLRKEVFGVPLSIILWGAAGSLAPILYRFYTEQGQIRFAAEFRWLIARPIIGIIMGAVVYLALVSGLVLVSAGEQANGDAQRLRAFWIIAFLAGFSDKFYLGVIDLLVARTVRTEEIGSNTVVTEIERIPDSTVADGHDANKPVPDAAGD